MGTILIRTIQLGARRMVFIGRGGGGGELNNQEEDCDVHYSRNKALYANNYYEVLFSSATSIEKFVAHDMFLFRRRMTTNLQTTSAVKQIRDGGVRNRLTIMSGQIRDDKYCTHNKKLIILHSNHHHHHHENYTLASQ